MSSKEPTHTKGPWKIFDGWGASKDRPIIVDSIPDVDGKCVANCICYVATTNQQFAANAALIAQAPELLARVEQLERMLTIDGIEDLVVDNARLQSAYTDAARDVAQLVETNQRLRELLRRVVDSASGDDFGSVGVTLLVEIKKELDK